MKGRTLVALSAALLGSVAMAPTMASATTCAQLATDSAYGLAGNPRIISPTSAVVTSTGHAAYCNVQFTYSAASGPEDGYAPGESQAIKIGIGLPLSSDDGGTGGVTGAWNGKLENLGGGGCAGSVGSTTSATDAGYVGSSTDTGHTSAENGSLCNFGVIQASHTLNVGKINDFIYEGVHQQVEWTKALAKAYYGMRAVRNYWNGCSTGGRQGLALAEKYGDEFDGFVIGAPAIYWQEFRLSDVWPALVNRDDLVAKGLPALTAAQYNAANSSAIAACDVQGSDSVQDGMIDDPRACTWSAKNNICGAPNAPAAPNCMTAEQAAALDKIWDGPRNHLGKRIWHPFDRGTPAGGLISFGALPSSTGQVMAYDHKDLTFAVDNIYSSRAAAGANALDQPHPVAYEDEAVLGAARGGPGDMMETQDYQSLVKKVHKHGGKIIMWQGAADPAIRWRDSVDFYRRVATYVGNGRADFAGLQSWFRYYHAPGVAHCGGGVGPSPTTTLPNKNTQLFDDLVNWVEKGIPPSSAGAGTHGGILATGGSSNATRTRPICPWPTTAIYHHGDPNVAASYHCGGDLDANPVAVCKMLRTKYRHENDGSLDTDETGIHPGLCNDAVLAHQ